MIIQIFGSMKNQNTPNPKRTRFSEHPVVYEYSSKSKKEDPDNDSLLLDNDEDPSLTNNSDSQPQQKNQQIHSIKSGLDQIEAFLEGNSEPIRIDRPKAQIVSPLKPQSREQRPASEQKPQKRFSVTLRPEMTNGRETMSIEEENQVHCWNKFPPEQISNNKRRAQELETESKEASLSKKIQDQLKKKERITMDVKGLLEMINSYEKEDAKLKQQSNNRITMDMFAIGKMLQQAALEEEMQERPEDEDVMTPVRPKKTKVFSAFKNGASQSEMNMQVEKYLVQKNRDIEHRQKNNEYLLKVINQFKHEVSKNQIKTADSNKRREELQREADRFRLSNQHLEKQLASTNFKKVKDNMRVMEEKLGFEVIRYDNDDEWNYYGHFYIMGIYAKIKATGRNSPAEIKLNNSFEQKNSPGFLINHEQSLKILKRYCTARIPPMRNPLAIAVQLKKAYQAIRELDLCLQYLAVTVKLSDFELNSNSERLNFKSIIGIGEFVIQIDLLSYLEDPQNIRSLSIYDTLKHRFVDLAAHESRGLLFGAMLQLINEYAR